MIKLIYDNIFHAGIHHEKRSGERFREEAETGSIMRKNSCLWWSDMVQVNER